MKILWLAPQPPVTPMTGGRERARRMIEYLAARHEVHLVTEGAREEQGEIDAMRGMLASVTRLDYPRKYRVRRIPKQPWDISIEIINDIAPDALHVQVTPLWGLRSFIPRRYHGQIVFDCHDVPRRENLKFKPDLLSRLLGYKPSFNIGNVDTVIAVSDEDAAAISPYRQGGPIVVLPNGVDVAYWSTVPRDIPAEPVLLFPAALNWGPNIIAAREFASAMPLLRERVPEARLIIAGHMPGTDLLKISERDPSITIIPDPPDMRPLFAQAQVIIVPLLHGTGTRLKILQALAAGRPVISTPVGAAGLRLEPGKHLLVAELTHPFVDELVRLLTDGDLRRSLADAGRAVIGRYDWSNFLPILDTIYPP